MKKKNLALGSILLLFAILLGMSKDWLRQKGEVISLDSVVDAAVTSEGDYWIVDMGGKRILSVDHNLKVKQILRPKDVVKQLAVNKEDEVYLRAVTIRNQNNSIAQETIYQIGQKNKKLEAVYERTYESPRLRGEIFDLSGKTQDLILGIRNEQGFGFYRMEESGNLKELFFKGLKEADVWVSSGLFLEEEGLVYYCLQNGTIYEYDIKKDIETQRYNGAVLEGREGVPRNLSSDGENGVYFTDLGLRDIGHIKGGDVSYLVGNYLLKQEEFLEQESYIRINAENELVACSSYAVYLQKEGELVPYYEVEVGQKEILFSWLSKLSVAVIAVIMIYYLLALFYYILKNHDVTSKLMAAMCGVIGIITLLFLVMVIPDYKAQMMKELEYRTKNVAYLTAETIPAKDLLNLDSVADFRKDSYNRVKSTVDKIFLQKQGVEDFYCTIYTIRDDVITINYSSEEANGSVYPYDWTYEGSDEQKIIETKEGKVYTGYLNSDGNYTFSLYPIIKEELGVIGLVEVGVNTQPYEEHINDLILDLLITMVVAAVVIIFLLLEILVFWKGRKQWLEKKEKHLPNELLRTLVFLIFLVTNMATSFLPIYAIDLARNSGGEIAGELWASLIISAEVFAGAVLSLKGNVVLNKLGQRKAAIFSGIVMVSGMILRILPALGFLLLGQLLIGTGWGIILLIVNMRISMNEEEKDEGFAGYSAAAFNGINCGVVLGGFAMKFMSYGWIIFTAAVLSILILLHIWKFIKEEKQVQQIEERGEISLFCFLSKTKIWSFLLLLVLPVIACGYYLNYLYPILANETGIQESYIGYSYLLNGMVVLAMGNLLTKEIAKWLGRKVGLVLSVLLYGTAFFMVSSFQTIPVLFLSLIILGLADSFGLPLQSSYFMDLEETKEFGYDRAAGIYSLVENLAQSAGPLMFGYILIFGLSAGLKILALILMLFAFLFLGLSIIAKDKKEKKEKSK